MFVFKIVAGPENEKTGRIELESKSILYFRLVIFFKNKTQFL